jgi:pimeloyl-ACP methyl ester carboxylesterase
MTEAGNTPSGAVPTSRYLVIDGLRFHYLDWGAGLDPQDGPDRGRPTLVMLHGFTGHAHTWDRPAAALAGRYHVIALDQRGHGDSDWAPEYGSRAMIADLLGLLDGLRLDRVTLMGLSMGGNVAYLFAAAYPERVDRLVVLDIGPEVAAAGLARIAAGLRDTDSFASVDEAVAQARAANPRPTDASLRHRVAHNLRPGPDGTLTFKWDKSLRDGTASRPDHGADERWDAWRSVQVPTLLVRGGVSDVLSTEVAERMLSENPNATLAIVPDSGHSITLDRPDGLIEVLTPWL